MSTAVASLSGVVTGTNSGNPISGASVSVGSGTIKQASATTDSSGAYSIQSIPAGTYDVVVTAEGYNSESTDLSLPSGSTQINFTLKHMSTAEALTGNGIQPVTGPPEV